MAVDNWTQTQWDTFYRTRDLRPESPTYRQYITGYGKERFLAQGAPDHLGTFRARWAAVTSNLAIQTTDTVLVIGCGFGYLIEAAQEAGYTEVYGLDSSPYVDSVKDVEASGNVIIVPDDVRAPQVRNALQAATGYRTFDWVITEDVVACYHVDDQGGTIPQNQLVQNFDGPLNNLLNNTSTRANILHITSIRRQIGGDSAFTWLTLEEWSQILPTHNWLAAGSHEFIAATV